MHGKYQKTLESQTKFVNCFQDIQIKDKIKNTDEDISSTFTEDSISEYKKEAELPLLDGGNLVSMMKEQVEGKERNNQILRNETGGIDSRSLKIPSNLVLSSVSTVQKMHVKTIEIQIVGEPTFQELLPTPPEADSLVVPHTSTEAARHRSTCHGSTVTKITICKSACRGRRDLQSAERRGSRISIKKFRHPFIARERELIHKQGYVSFDRAPSVAEATGSGCSQQIPCG